MPTTREEAATAKGRYARVNQTSCGREPRELPPFFYGQVVEVDGSGNYLRMRFSGRRERERWYHRNDVHLHPPSGATGV